MSDEIVVSIQYPEEITTESTVTQVGPRLYRLEDDPHFFLVMDEEEFADLPRYGDVIEAEEIEPAVLKFLRVARRSKLKRYSCLVPEEFTKSDEMRVILSTIENNGGHWELVCGGMFFA